MTVTATTRHLFLPPEIFANHTFIDICFDGARVWSVSLAEHQTARSQKGILWPDSLHRYLTGCTELAIKDSTSGELLASAEVRFTQDSHRTEVRDTEGRALSVNKWGAMGKTLGAEGSELRVRLLTRTLELLSLLDAAGMRPFIVGGTLLGAVRDGKLIPHDDDADIAFLSQFTHPADVALQGLRLARSLRSQGYEVVQHSAVHLQITFRHPNGSLDHYIDIFGAFFDKDGNINQPFHVRGPFSKEDMLPFSSVKLEGHILPAPRNTEKWLTLNYDENWRTPQPGFRIVTPEETRQRFLPWFGAYNHAREFWNDSFAREGKKQDVAARAGAKWLLRQEASLHSADLLELGSGTGRLAVRLATRATVDGRARRVIATDYSFSALQLIRARKHPSVTTLHLNLSRLDAIAAPRRAGVSGAFDVVANHVLEYLPFEALPQALRLIRMALHSGGSAIVTCRETVFNAADFPAAKTLSRAQLESAAKDFGLLVSFKEIDKTPKLLPGVIYGAIFHLEPHQDNSLLDQQHQ